MSAAAFGAGARPARRYARLRRLAAWLARRRGVGRLALAAALGAVGCAAFAPVHFPPALLPSLAGLVFLVDGAGGARSARSARSARGAFAIGFAWGAGHFAVGLYWVGNAFIVADRAVWAAPFAVAGLAALCAAYPAAACALYRRLAPRGVWRPVVFAGAWTLLEWLRGSFPLGGFPWNLAGYVWTPWPFAVQFAAVAGVYGLGWFTVFAAVSPAALADRRTRRAPAGPWAPVAALALLAVNAAAGAALLARADPAAPAPQARLRLVQANVEQARKWNRDLLGEHFRRHEALSTAPGAPTLVVWPETASPLDLSQPFAEREHALRSAPPGGALVSGALRREAAPGGGRRLWNSLQALDSEGRLVGQYDKARLVPFGEYVPFLGLPFVARIVGDASGFARGPGPRTLAVPGAPPFSPLICYEAIFPGAAVDPAARPAWLLNVTNDAWYGRSPGPYQHFEQARLRAVEEGLPLARVAGTGISGVVDAWGRVVAKRGLGEAGTVDAALPPPRPPTPFSRLGNAPATAWALAGLLLFALRRRAVRTARAA